MSPSSIHFLPIKSYALQSFFNERALNLFKLFFEYKQLCNPQGGIHKTSREHSLWFIAPEYFNYIE
jgi:hypothetical protein